MLRHLFKLIWKRKGRNLMLSFEILIAFVIVFAVAAFAVRSFQLYHMPLGFVADDVWSVEMQSASNSNAIFDNNSYEQIKRGLLGLPEVKNVAFANAPPFASHGMWSDVAVAGTGARLKIELVEMTDDYPAVLDVALVAGRTFSREDDGAASTPVIINRRLASEMFGDASPIGKEFDNSSPSSKTRNMMRVIGMVGDFRKGGDFDAPHNVVFFRYKPQVTVDGLRTILIKMAPGTPRAFEEKLQKQLKLIRNDLSYEIAPLASLRKSAMSARMVPMMILAVIAGFLLLMVAFGLFGVLWQNTTRRIPEIGLRRAIGASAGNIYRQIIAEQFLLSSGAMLVALILLIQLPLTGVLGESLNGQVFFGATLLSMAAIYLISLLCSVYPGWRASRLSPTEALHYE
ncbi:MAG: FtsX-like permease family protein [Pseudomonadota bacterium]